MFHIQGAAQRTSIRDIQRLDNLQEFTFTTKLLHKEVILI